MKAHIGYNKLITFLESEIEKKDNIILKLEKEMNNIKLFNFVELEQLNNEMDETIDDMEQLFKNYIELEKENLILTDKLNNLKQK